jgi:hypothetical protein
MLTGMLLLGIKIGAISRSQARYFRVTFTPSLELRGIVHEYRDGEPFVGPDGYAIRVNSTVL